jgi:NADH-quinone oxidoreductase subunit M
VSEFLVMVGAFVHHYLYAVFAVFGIVLSALYILLMYQRTMTGPVRPEVRGMSDLGVREVASLAPLLALVIGLGFFPRPLLDVIEPAVATTLQHVGAEDPGPTIEGAADTPATEEGE